MRMIFAVAMGCVQGSGSISKNRIKVENCEIYLKNQKKMRMIFTVAMMLKGLCSGFRVHI